MIAPWLNTSAPIGGTVAKIKTSVKPGQTASPDTQSQSAGKAGSGGRVS